MPPYFLDRTTPLDILVPAPLYIRCRLLELPSRLQTWLPACTQCASPAADSTFDSRGAVELVSPFATAAIVLGLLLACIWLQPAGAIVSLKPIQYRDVTWWPVEYPTAMR